jgi:hypothetical protein
MKRAKGATLAEIMGSAGGFADPFIGDYGRAH